MMRFLKTLFLLGFFAITCTTFAETPKASVNVEDNVIANIAKNTDVANFHVNVRTQGSLVFLAGTVDSVTNAATLVLIAEATQGVSDVDISNLIITQSTAGLADRIIEAKIKGTYLREKTFGDITVKQLPVTPSSNQGLVMLDGVVADHTQLINSILLAQKIPGVYRVISRLTIRHVSVSMPN